MDKNIKKFKKGQIIKCIRETNSKLHKPPLNELFKVMYSVYDDVSVMSMKTGIRYRNCAAIKFILLPNKKLYKRIL